MIRRRMRVRLALAALVLVWSWLAAWSARGALLVVLAFLAALIPGCGVPYPATLDEYVARRPEAEIRPGQAPDTFIVSTGWVIHRLGVAQSLAFGLALCRNRNGFVDAPRVELDGVLDLPRGPTPHTRLVTRTWIEARFEIERGLQAHLGSCLAEAATESVAEDTPGE